MNQNNRILNLAKNCNFLDLIPIIDENLCVKTRFLNAVLNRWENYTQENVSKALGISKRTVDNLERGKVTNVVTIFKYISYFGKNYAKERKNNNCRKYYGSKKI